MSQLARAAIRRLRAGVVPEWEIQRLAVGYGDAQTVVNSSLERLCSSHAAEPLFVRGEWGTGKTFFLSYVRSAASARSVPSAFISLNGRSAALNYPQRFYPLVAEHLYIAPDSIGLRSLLMALLINEQMVHRVQKFAAESNSREFGAALTELCDDRRKGNLLLTADHVAWRCLLGSDLSWADYSYKREQALARIRYLAALLHAVGHNGLVLRFDELETIDQLWNVKSRCGAYSVLGELCSLPNVWCVLGITGRFERAIDSDFAKGILGDSGLSDNAVSFLRRWQNRTLSIMDVPRIGTSTARHLAAGVADLYQAAYSGFEADPVLVEHCVAEWRRNPSQNPRRLIRLIIHKLDLQSNGGPLTAA